MSILPVNESFDRSNAVQARLHELIPGGAHTYARGSDQYPEHMTPVLVRGRVERRGDPDAQLRAELSDLYLGSAR